MCIYICIYIYIYICTYMYVHTYICTCTHEAHACCVCHVSSCRPSPYLILLLLLHMWYLSHAVIFHSAAPISVSKWVTLFASLPHIMHVSLALSCSLSRFVFVHGRGCVTSAAIGSFPSFAASFPEYICSQIWSRISTAASLSCKTLPIGAPCSWSLPLNNTSPSGG